MKLQWLSRHRVDVLRRLLLSVSITAGATLWALAMLRLADVTLDSTLEFGAVWSTVGRAF